MTADDFRRIALALDGVVESAHHGHPDFRVGGRIFATLGYPNRESGMVNLTPDQQRTFVLEHAGGFAPVKGAWGEQGSTNVRLDAVDEETVGQAMTLAWRNAVDRGPSRGRGSSTATSTAAGRRASRTRVSRRTR